MRSVEPWYFRWPRDLWRSFRWRLLCVRSWRAIN